MHPVLTHVPPNLCRSIIATDIPAPLSRSAKDGPACPVPIMIASNFWPTLYLLVRNSPQQYRTILPLEFQGTNYETCLGRPQSPPCEGGDCGFLNYYPSNHNYYRANHTSRTIENLR